MLKRLADLGIVKHKNQPPSGGCVLKRIQSELVCEPFPPAAFGRLCVETISSSSAANASCPAAFGRLCVETLRKTGMAYQQPASRLRAAVC